MAAAQQIHQPVPFLMAQTREAAISRIVASSRRNDSKIMDQLTTPGITRSKSMPVEDLPKKKRFLSHNVINDPRNRVPNTQCFQSPTGFHYIYLDPYNDNEKNSAIIDEVSPLEKNKMAFEPNSVYTYVIMSTDAIDRHHGTITAVDPISIYTARAHTMYEFGSKHHQIFYRIAQRDAPTFKSYSKSNSGKNIHYTLYASGEIMCMPDDTDRGGKPTLFFNFYSGTYKMKRHISKGRKPWEERYIEYMMSPALQHYNIGFTDLPLLTPEIVPMTTSDLAKYGEFGVPNFEFRDKPSCNGFNMSVLRHKNTRKDVPLTNEVVSNIYAEYISEVPADQQSKTGWGFGWGGKKQVRRTARRMKKTPKRLSRRK
jgi:hypothetical protein